MSASSPVWPGGEDVCRIQQGKLLDARSRAELRRSFLAGKCIAVADWMQCRRNAEPAAVAIIATAEAKRIKRSFSTDDLTGLKHAKGPMQAAR